MAELSLEKIRIAEGLWIGKLSGADTAGTPEIRAYHLGVSVGGVLVQADPKHQGLWQVSVPIPAAALSEGVHTIAIMDGASQVQLGSFSIVTGAPLEDDIRAEVDLLRAELDMLKRAFRRHCVETAV